MVKTKENENIFFGKFVIIFLSRIEIEGLEEDTVGVCNNEVTATCSAFVVPVPLRFFNLNLHLQNMRSEVNPYMPEPERKKKCK